MAPKRPRELVTAGPLQIVIVVACTMGGLSEDFHSGDLPSSWSALDGVAGFVVGILLASSWSLVTAEPRPINEGHQRIRANCQRATRGTIFGFIEYPIQEWGSLRTPAAAMFTRPSQALEHMATHELGACSGGQTGRCLRNLLEQWRTAHGALTASLVKVGKHAALQMVTGAWSCLHSVAVTSRTARDRLLDRGKPSRVYLRRFVDAQTVARDARPLNTQTVPQHPPNLGWQHGRCQPDLVLEWLEASRFVRDVRRAGEAAKAFAPLFARVAKMSRSELLGNLQTVHAEVLRRSRVRLDCVAMLLFRRLWASLLGTIGHHQVNIYMYADASPQWRGLELYASSFEVFDGSRLQRRLFPMVSLDKAFSDAAGKCLALLWQAYLMVGPSFQMMRLFCSRVRSITTDQGVERLLANFPDVLRQFFGLVDPQYLPPKEEDPVAWLFPRAVAVPGWMHLWDLEIRRGLGAMEFFPHWIQGLKALVSFLRHSQHTELIARSFRSKGFDGAADLVQGMSIPNFAEWRWGTLLGCCIALSGSLASLAKHFDASLFRAAKDRTGISQMLAALRSEDWMVQFKFVHWFCQWLGGLMSWGRGCDCHGDALRAGQEVNCPLKGRRIREAHAFATQELRRGLAEANSWGPHTWPSGGASLWLDCQACVRSVYEMATRKISFLDRIPYLLARLGEPGVRRRCVEQWESCSAEKHHRVSREFMEGELRGHIDAMSDGGTGISARLQLEIDSLAKVPLDDSVAEGPHASASRMIKHARGAKWAWIAATMRLDQNLADAKAIPDVVGDSAQDLWPVYKSVLHGPSARDSRRCKKVTWKQLHEDVYKMGFVHGFVNDVKGLFDTKAAASLVQGVLGGADEAVPQVEGAGPSELDRCLAPRVGPRCCGRRRRRWRRRLGRGRRWRP